MAIVIGKCLQFYLKYPKEMERLYEAKEPSLAGLPSDRDPEDILERVRLVGEAACREVALILHECSLHIEQHLRSFCKVDRVQNSLASTWELKFKVRPKKQAKGKHVAMGVSIGPASLIPWVWCRSSLQSEIEVVDVLPGRCQRSSSLIDWYAGTVLLDQVTMEVRKELKEYDAAPVVEKVIKAFKKLKSHHIDQLYSIANSR